MVDRGHETALAMAREGLVEKATMDREAAKLNKANNELTKELVAARSTALSLEKRAAAAEA
jgi:hypothetical protein